MALMDLAGGLAKELGAEVGAELLVGGARNSPSFDASKVTLTPSGIENTIRASTIPFALRAILEHLAGAELPAITGGFDSIQDRIAFDRDQANASFRDVSRTWLEREVGRIAAQNRADIALTDATREWDRAVNNDNITRDLYSGAMTNSASVANAATQANAQAFDSASKYATGLANAISNVRLGGL